MGRRPSIKRDPPTKRQLVQALIDPWTLFDLLNFHGGRKQFGKCHHDLVEFGFFSEEDQWLALMPRSHLKTTLMSVGRALYCLYVNPNIRIYVGSAHKDLAKAILREVCSNLVDPWNQKYIWNNRPHYDGRLIPIMDQGLESRRRQLREMTEEEREEARSYKKQIWHSEAIQVISPYQLKEPSVAVGSAESLATGFHYDTLILDDIISFDNANSDDKVERLYRWRDDMMSVLDDVWFDEELYDRLCACSRSKRYRDRFHRLAHVGGQISVSGTRYFKGDWYGEIEEEIITDLKEGNKPLWTIFKRNIYQNGVDSQDGYLWREKWNEKIEKKKRKQMRAKQWYSQYLNKIIVDEEQTLSMDLVRQVPAANIMYDDNKPGIAKVRVADGSNDFSRVIKLHMVVDPAATYSKRSDFTAIGVGGYDDDNNLFLLDARVLKVHTNEWANTVFDLCAKWGLRVFNLETVAFAETLKLVFHRMFKDRFPLVIKDYKPSPHTSKKDRIESNIEPLLKNEMLFIATNVCQQREVQDQMNFFPSENVKDDFPDMLSMLAEVSKPTNQKVYAIRKRKRKVIPFNRIYGGVY